MVPESSYSAVLYRFAQSLQLQLYPSTYVSVHYPLVVLPLDSYPVIAKSFDVPSAINRNTYISIVKTTRRTNASNLLYFGITLHVSGDLSVHH